MTSTEQIMETVESADAAYYAGSHLLLPISKAAGLSLDSVNFVGKALS